MGFFDSLSRGLERSREALNQIFYFGGDVTEDFWEDLEDTLVMGDMGADIAMQVTDDLRDMAAKRNLTSARQLREALTDRLSETFVSPEFDPFDDTPSVVLFVGINGAGKTTTVGKIATPFALPQSSSWTFGASARAFPLSSVIEAATLRAFAMTSWTRPTSAEASLC